MILKILKWNPEPMDANIKTISKINKQTDKTKTKLMNFFTSNKGFTYFIRRAIPNPINVKNPRKYEENKSK